MVKRTTLAIRVGGDFKQRQKIGGRRGEPTWKCHGEGNSSSTKKGSLKEIKGSGNKQKIRTGSYWREIIVV